MLPNKASTSKNIFFLKVPLQLFVSQNIVNIIVDSRFAFDELFDTKLIRDILPFLSNKLLIWCTLYWFQYENINRQLSIAQVTKIKLEFIMCSIQQELNYSYHVSFIRAKFLFGYKISTTQNETMSQVFQFYMK